MNVSPFTPLNNPLDCFVPAALALTLRLASSRTAGARLRHVASQALRAIQLKPASASNPQNTDKTKDHAMHGLLFCWIPAATYSPGPSPVKYHRRMKA